MTELCFPLNTMCSGFPVEVGMCYHMRHFMYQRYEKVVHVQVYIHRNAMVRMLWCGFAIIA